LQPLVGAIAAGNCAMVKPGSYAKASGRAMVELIGKYLDPDAIKACQGDRTVTNALMEHRWDMIFFTGSGGVGKVIAEKAGRHLTPIVLELGGKSPCVVDRTADLDAATNRIAWGALLNSGQTCVRPDYFLVHADVKRQFLELLQAKIGKMYDGKPDKSEWFGRIINDNSWKRLTRLMEDAARFKVFGGETDASSRYIHPTIFDFGEDFASFERSKLMEDEIFGPLFPVCGFRDLQEPIGFVRRRDKPLAAYIFGDSTVARQFTTETAAGAVVVSDVIVHLSNSNLPFGGVGASGMGRYHGRYSFNAFSHRKPVLSRPKRLGEVSLRYPPFTATKQKLLLMLMNPQVAILYDRMMKKVTVQNAFTLALFVLAVTSRLPTPTRLAAAKALEAYLPGIGGPLARVLFPVAG